MESEWIFLLVGVIVCSTLMIISTVFGVIIWWLRRKKRLIAREWEQEGPIFLRGPVGINFSGIESQGMGQIRGSGFMALTDQDLRVTRAAPAVEWRFLHQDIKDVELDTSFLGKRRGRMKALVITFEQEGQLDRIGIYVRNNTVWVDEILRVIEG